MYIDKKNEEIILHAEQGFDLVDKKSWDEFTPTDEEKINDTYRFKIAYLPDDITIDYCQNKYLEVKEIEEHERI